MRAHGPNGAVYLITMRTHGGRALFAQASGAALFCTVLRRLKRRLGFRLHAFVLLPDRVRLLLGLGDRDPRSVRMVVQQLKSRFAREANARAGRLDRLWQDEDQRSEIPPQDISRRADYIHRSPLMARLARAPGEWRWSSYRAWAGEGPAPVPIDLPGRGGVPFSG